MFYKIFFQLSHSDGTIIDESWVEPFIFERGDGQLDACLERCVASSKLHRLETFLLTADEAFGNREDEAVQVMQRDDFSQKLELKIGLAVEFDIPNGTKVLGYIKDIADNDITVDFNHLLAGHNIVFKVEILEIFE